MDHPATPSCLFRIDDLDLAFKGMPELESRN